jgi:hypothetical protein
LGRWSALTVVAAVLFCARFVAVGADTYWAVALGRDIARNGIIPEGVPFAAAVSTGWPNVPVLGEVVLAGVAIPGPIGIVAFQLALDAVALVILAVGARRAGASDGATAIALALGALGALPALASVKMQLLSLLPFALLTVLLRADHSRPSRRIWWVVPLVAIWGNLHGAVLLGVAVTGAYLLFSRLRRSPSETIMLGLATLLALAANPALFGTIRYYAGVLGNEAARRGAELWSRPDPASVFDLLLIFASLVLVVVALLSRPPLWEVVTILGLLAGTVSSARHGVWLLMFCVAPAARRMTRNPDRTVERTSLAIPIVAGLIVLLGSAVLLGSRMDVLNPSGRPDLVQAVKAAAEGRVVLADEPIAESLAAEGVRIWMSNPIDAFDQGNQSAYLDFIAGSPSAAMDSVDIIVLRAGSPADTLVTDDGRFALAGQHGGWRIFRRS